MSVASDTQHGVDFQPKGLLLKCVVQTEGWGTMKLCAREKNVCRREVLQHRPYVCGNKTPPACGGGAPWPLFSCPLLLPRKVTEGEVTWLQRANRKS